MNKTRISIVDYGMGNVLSVLRAFEVVGYSVELVSTPNDIKNSGILVIPGVGAFPNAMQLLLEKELVEPIKHFAISGKLVIGICLGMQLLFEKSYEYRETFGLGLIEGEVQSFKRIDSKGKEIKIPHVGWNKVNFKSPQNIFLAKENLDSTYYFVHSFHAVVKHNLNTIAVSNYGEQDFTSAVSSQNILGFQFHPEKSGKKGLELIRAIKIE